MKKILSMFAFAATIVLGALTLASCGDDDVITPVNVKHKYSPAIEIITSKPEWKEDAKLASANLTQNMKDSLQSYEMELTQADAAIFWAKLTNANLDKYMQSMADSCGQLAQDTSLKTVFKLMEDGKVEFKRKEWLTTYWLKVN